MTTEYTPTPWHIQEHPNPEETEEFYVAGQKTEDHPYHNATSLGPEILSDDDYPRKRADGKRIVECVNALEGIDNPVEWVEQAKMSMSWRGKGK